MSSQARVTVSSTATQIVAANTDRRSLWIQNTGSYIVYIGFDNTVDTTDVYLTPVGSKTFENIIHDYKGALWGITSSTSSTVSYLEF